MALDKNTADRMARGSKKSDNVVFGQLNNIAEYHKFGKFKVDYKGGVELSLDEIVASLLGEIDRLTSENKKLHRLIKTIAKDLDDYKGKVGIR